MHVLTYTHVTVAGGFHVFSQNRLRTDFQDPSYPQLALVNAERAWAYAMQLKQDAENVDNPRLKFHSLQRLRKAVYWSKKLAELAAVRGDERTSLECEAYKHWLTGNAELESDRWETALENFVAAQTIYKKLLLAASVVEQDLFTRRMKEIATQVEFIQYKIDLNLGKGSAAGLIAQMQASSGELGLLTAKMEGVLQEERLKNTSTLSRVEWCGHHIPIDNTKVRVAILRTQDLAAKLEQLLLTSESDPESEAFEEVYFDLMHSFDEAQHHVERDIASVTKVTLKADEVKLQMALLRSYIKSLKLEHTIRKNAALIRVYVHRWQRQQRGFGHSAGNAPNEKVVRTVDVVKLHDTVLQNIADAQALQGAESDVAYQNKCRWVSNGVLMQCVTSACDSCLAYIWTLLTHL